ncbi:MAG TPA: chromate transporter [Kiritimatiellia bacterium]|nr:chromate transporter [Kiritimatiellia bacterium]HPS09366.1 chromate transporter [Kiritimatiellia bacterium]
MDNTHAKAPYSLAALVKYALKLGTLGFGGPIALVGYMYRDLVKDRKWISESDYSVGLTLSQLMPGPLAAQLAIYLGYVDYGVVGATAVGLGFVLPSFVMVVALGWAYVHFGGLPWMQAAFYGVGACVIGIIARSACTLIKHTVGKDLLLAAVCLAAAAVTVITEAETVWIFLAAGVLVWLIRAPPKLKIGRRMAADGVAPFLFIAMAGMASCDGGVLWRIFAFFGKAGAFVFGSGLAIVPFLYGGVVNEYHWLNDRQFMDAVAVAMITPGPVVITVGFIGYLVAGLPGACVAAFATFLPCYLFTIFPAPYFKKYGTRPDLAAFVNGVTAAAIGSIAGAVVVLGRRSITDAPTAGMALGTLFLCWKFRGIPEPLLVLGAAAVGLITKLWVPS